MSTISVHFSEKMYRGRDFLSVCLFFIDVVICLLFRLECLIASGEETCEAGDLDLIQHMNVDMLKLTRLLNGRR